MGRFGLCADANTAISANARITRTGPQPKRVWLGLRNSGALPAGRAYSAGASRTGAAGGAGRRPRRIASDIA